MLSVCAQSLQSCLTLCDPIDCSLQCPSVRRFSRQEYWSGLSFPSSGDLPNPGIEPRSPRLQADDLTSEPLAQIRIKCGHKYENALEIVKLSLFSSYLGRGSVCFRVICPLSPNSNHPSALHAHVTGGQPRLNVWE